MIAAFIIWCVCAALFILIGLKGRRSQNPMGFWANVKAPDSGRIKDVQRYNRAVSNLLIVYGLLFAALGLPFLFCSAESAAVLFIVLGVVFLTIALMVCYVFIEAKYRK